MGVIVFNGIPSTEYQIHVEKPPVYAMPERDYSVVHIPGRNGDIVVDSGSYREATIFPSVNSMVILQSLRVESANGSTLPLGMHVLRMTTSLITFVSHIIAWMPKWRIFSIMPDG